MAQTATPTLTPEDFKQRILQKYPQGVASDGTPYSKMDATDLTQRIVSKYPDATTKDGHKYSDFLPKEQDNAGSSIQEEHGPGAGGLVGSLISSLLKTPARLATNVVQAGEALTGNKQTQPFDSKFLGEVKPVGQEGTFGQRVKDSLGAGTELGSYLIGGGETKAGIEALKAGELLGKPVLKTAIKGGATGAGIGATAGVGREMQNPNSNATSIASQGLMGGLLGGVTGGVLGLGGQALEKSGLLNKTVGATDERMANAMQDVRAGYEEAMKKNNKTISMMQKDDALGKDTVGDLLNQGIIPQFNEDGTRLDTTKGMSQIEASNELFKPALGEAIKAENKPMSYSALEKQLVSQLGKYKNTADEGALARELSNRMAQFKQNGDVTDLVNLQDIKNKASADSIGAYNPLNDSPTSIKKRAAKEIFLATKKLINDNIAPDSPVRQINDILEKNHRMSDVLDVIHNSTVKRGKLGKYITEMAGGAVGNIIGGAVGGIPGQIFGTIGGGKVGDMVAEYVMKNSLGSASSRALLQKLQNTDAGLYQQVLQKIKDQAIKKAGIPKLESGAIRMGPQTPAPQGPATVLRANKNPVTANPKTGKYQTTYNSSGK